MKGTEKFGEKNYGKRPFSGRFFVQMDLTNIDSIIAFAFFYSFHEQIFIVIMGTFSV